MLRSKNLTGVFMDTSGQLKIFSPAGAASDRGMGPEGGIGKFMSPFFEINSFDLFDDEHLFFLGRPLWRTSWENRLDRDYRKLVKFAVHKLAGDHCELEDRHLTLLCRFGFDPDFELAERLIGSHMATLFDMTIDRIKLMSGYRSEPILAEASAYQTMS